MYILNNKEKACLITIAKRTRDKYLKKNKYTFLEDNFDVLTDEKLISSDSTGLEFEREIELDIVADNIEKVFTDLYVLKSTKNLSFREKLVLFSYYVENKTDERIGRELHIKEDTIRKIRKRALDKIEERYRKFMGDENDV